jgi:hypothetical protein
MILYLSIWGGSEAGIMRNPQSTMADINRCMEYLKRCESRWHIAGRGWTILHELVSISSPLPVLKQGVTLKRPLEDEERTTGGYRVMATSSTMGSSMYLTSETLPSPQAGSLTLNGSEVCTRYLKGSTIDLN